MITTESAPPSFWTTVRVLLAATRRRATGRKRRQQELLNQRAGKSARDWGSLGIVMAVLFALLPNGLGAFALMVTVDEAQRAAAELNGKMVVSSEFLAEVRRNEHWQQMPDSASDPRQTHRIESWRYLAQQGVEKRYASEARTIARRDKGNAGVIEQQLRKVVSERGSHGLVTRSQAVPGLRGLARSGPLPAMLGSVLLLWWLVMLVCQGEGLELDLQRRRHPMWEWLLSHPIQPGAVFFAEMLGPIAANPIYWTAPIFPGMLYGVVYGSLDGLAAVVLVGLPVTFTAACLGKALEIGIMLRFSMRTRGAMLGAMSWLGYSS